MTTYIHIFTTTVRLMTLCCDSLVGTVRTQTHIKASVSFGAKNLAGISILTSHLSLLYFCLFAVCPRPAIISEKKNHKYVVTHRDPGSNVIKFDVEQNSNSFK